MAAVSDLGLFGELAGALEPWLDQVVIVGGWAHRPHRLHPSARSLSYPPLVTLDADIAVPRLLPVEGQDIRERLISRGFTEEFLGRDRPPVTHYHLGASSPSRIGSLKRSKCTKPYSSKIACRAFEVFQFWVNSKSQFGLT